MPPGRYIPPARGHEPVVYSLAWQLWVEQGIRDLRVYLDRWAAFSEWCRTHNRGVGGAE